tara:strand:+ start:1380 stop:1499 length:120 start_codon:yes stop_codon:yes gene_type:complete
MKYESVDYLESTPPLIIGIETPPPSKGNRRFYRSNINLI